jgi:hypothetical protein
MNKSLLPFLVLSAFFCLPPMMFFAFASCTLVYFITTFFFLPETKGETLEEIEAYFEGKKH